MKLSIELSNIFRLIAMNLWSKIKANVLAKIARHGNVSLLVKDLFEYSIIWLILYESYNTSHIIWTLKNVQYLKKKLFEHKKNLCNARFVMAFVHFYNRQVSISYWNKLRSLPDLFSMNNVQINEFGTIQSRQVEKYVAAQRDKVSSDFQNHVNGRWRRILSVGELHQVLCTRLQTP